MLRKGLYTLGSCPLYMHLRANQILLRHMAGVVQLHNTA